MRPRVIFLFLQFVHSAPPAEYEAVDRFYFPFCRKEFISKPDASVLIDGKCYDLMELPPCKNFQ